MSSDIDEQEGGCYPATSPTILHSYVNLVDREEAEEAKPALPARREKGRESSRKEGRRKSRSRDREKRPSLTDYERVKEREQGKVKMAQVRVEVMREKMMIGLSTFGIIYYFASLIETP